MPKFARRQFARFARRLGLALYCIAIWLTLDLIYSHFTYVHDTPVRRADDLYDHGLLANVTGTISWGSARYDFHTNSLGFRDAAVRDVPMKAIVPRIVLIGDSFTEAVGMPFSDSFAGMLAQA